MFLTCPCVRLFHIIASGISHLRLKRQLSVCCCCDLDDRSSLQGEVLTATQPLNFLLHCMQMKSQLIHHSGLLNVLFYARKTPDFSSAESCLLGDSICMTCRAVSKLLSYLVIQVFHDFKRLCINMQNLLN